MADVPAIDVEELQKRLQSATPPLVIDVREPREHDICAIPTSRLIPLGNLPDYLNELPKDLPIVMHCHHGGRSSRAVALMQQHGFTNAINLAGGIHAWAQRIDKNMKTYE